MSYCDSMGEQQDFIETSKSYAVWSRAAELWLLSRRGINVNGAHSDFAKYLGRGTNARIIITTLGEHCKSKDHRDSVWDARAGFWVTVANMLGIIVKAESQAHNLYHERIQLRRDLRAYIQNDTRLQSSGDDESMARWLTFASQMKHLDVGTFRTLN